MSRIKQLKERSDVGEDRYAEIDRINEIAPHGVGDGAFGLLLYSPGLSLKVVEATMQVHSGLTLTRREQEIAIVATCQEDDAVRLLGRHVENGRHLGVKEATIDAIQRDGDTSQLDPDNRAIVTYVRQLLRAHRVDQKLFEELRDHHSERWVVELAAVIGHYRYLAAVQNAFEVRLIRTRTLVRGELPRAR